MQTSHANNNGQEIMQTPWQLALAAITAFVLTLVAVTACSDDSESVDEAGSTTPTTTATTSTIVATPSTSAATTSTTAVSSTSEPLTLEDRIVANMQGAQIEYQDVMGDDPFGVVFFHHRNWATEAFEFPVYSGEYCERATYTWDVVEATNESNFTIEYKELTEDPDCLVINASSLTAVFSGSQEVDGRTVYDFAYTAGLGDTPITGTRTVCSTEWDDPEPCGQALPGFERSTPPQGD